VILSENGSMQMHPARISTNKQTNAEGKQQSKEQSGLKGKQMPNIAFHRPKKNMQGKARCILVKLKKKTLFLFSMLMYS